MADQFRTGDAALTGSVSYLVQMPAALWYIAEVMDLLGDLADKPKWLQVGSVTVDEAVEAGLKVLRGFHPMIGQVIPYITAEPPENCLICDGSVYDRVDYPDLYGMLASVFIIDADTFSVPDLRGKTIIGMSTAYSMGSTGGESEHTLTGSEMPSHGHSDTGHLHTTGNSFTFLALTGEEPVLMPNPIPANTGLASANITNSGGDGAHNNMQPYVALQYAVIAR